MNNDERPPPRLVIESRGLRSRYTVTAAIAVVCVLLFLTRYLWPATTDNEHLMRMGADFAPKVKAGEIYRLFASAFLHGDGLHLAMNMIALASFGPVLEALFGARRYLVLYGVSALVGSLASTVANGLAAEPRMSVGASGAVWGLMTAGIAIVYRPQGLLPETALANARQRAWAPLVLNLMYSFKPGIDLLAHLGGGAAGAALVLSGALTRGVRPMVPIEGRGDAQERSSLLWTGLAALTTAAMAGSVIIALLIGKPWEAGKPPVLVRTPIGDTGVSMELPSETAKRSKLDSSDGSPSYIFGEVNDDPFLFEVGIIPLETTVAAEAVESELQVLVDDLKKSPMADTTAVTAPHIESVGGRRVVALETKLKNDVPVKSYFVLAGPRIVVMRSYGVDARPKSWAGIEEKIVASIEPR